MQDTFHCRSFKKIKCHVVKALVTCSIQYILGLTQTQGSPIWQTLEQESCVL